MTKTVTVKKLAVLSLIPLFIALFVTQRADAIRLVNVDQNGRIEPNNNNPTTQVSSISIADARKQSVGSSVSVAGRVTAANQFGSPAYIQDSTGGIAVYDYGFADSVSIGDSVQVTGILDSYNNLLEIKNITYNVISTAPDTVKPKVITISQIGETYEGQLITIKNATIQHSGPFSADANYNITDATGTAQMRIDKDTDLPGSIAPMGKTNITGILGQYNTDYQLMPRDTTDVGVGNITYPGSDVPMSETFDVATWNMLWFGNASNGPTDDQLQLVNALKVIRHINADLYAVEEVSNTTMFQQLLDSLPDYHGFEANYSQVQKTAFIFKTSTVDSLDSHLVTDAGSSYDWANGRYPLEFTFNAKVNGKNKLIYAYVIHAKASTSDPATDYSRRVAAAAALKNYLVQNHSQDNVMVLGDYNDDVDESIYNNQTSPYAPFVSDSADFDVITYPLSEDKYSSFVDGTEMIDHITISNDLRPNFFAGTERIENTAAYVTDYSKTTSDHYPVWARFKLDTTTPIEKQITEQKPKQITLEQNYPNPFNPSTNITFILPKRETVSLDIYNILGQNVGKILSHQALPAGSHTYRFDATNLPSGIYFYRLESSSGTVETRKMTLLK